VQRLVSVRLFGDADDPQQVLHRLAVRLEASSDPESLVAATVDTAAETLRLPYVAVQLATDGSWRVVHQRGRRTDDVEHFDITVGDHVVGRLVVAAHRDGRTLSPLDRRILSDLARHSGVAARVVALLTDLRAAQQRLLVAREDERHRIHRDLHDGIGPTLVGLTLQLEVAAELADGGDLAALLRRLHTESARTTDDVRRMVRALRPGELEELGLPAAVAAAAARLSSPHAPHFDLDTPLSLPKLDAAVEDAAYKICLEAMANVIRHSGARRCTVRLSHTGDRLEIDVIDDGCGLRPPVDGDPGHGTGLSSMRDRASAVGGQLAITACSGGGTQVSAVLPTARTEEA
jgi:signal transduction histidine kinase